MEGTTMKYSGLNTLDDSAYAERRHQADCMAEQIAKKLSDASPDIVHVYFSIYEEAKWPYTEEITDFIQFVVNKWFFMKLRLDECFEDGVAVSVEKIIDGMNQWMKIISQEELRRGSK